MAVGGRGTKRGKRKKRLTLRRRQGSQENALFLVALALDMLYSDGLNSQSQVVALLARRGGRVRRRHDGGFFGVSFGVSCGCG